MDNSSSTTDHHDFDRYIERLLQGKQLTEAEILNLCEKAKEILSQEPNIRYISSPVTICGNINGQFEGLVELFQVAGKIPDTNYLFLGNYTYRGWNGVSTISLLLAYKVRYRERITLLRGVGENRYMSQAFGFYDECFRKYENINVWKSFTEVFDYLPLVAIVENAFFCVHNGLSPEIDTLDQIKSLNRVQETPNEGPLFDFLWSEPGDIEGWGLIPRAAGYYFSQDVTRKFFHINNLKMMCRGHQYGYSLEHSGLVVTICSAPDYIGQMKNPGAVFELDDTLDMNYITFEAAPRPEKQASRRAPDYFVGKTP